MSWGTLPKVPNLPIFDRNEQYPWIGPVCLWNRILLHQLARYTVNKYKLKELKIKNYPQNCIPKQLEQPSLILPPTNFVFGFFRTNNIFFNLKLGKYHLQGRANLIKSKISYKQVESTFICHHCCDQLQGAFCSVKWRPPLGFFAGFSLCQW